MPMTADGLVKLAEECGELIQIINKKLAYFTTDEHPDGKGSLKTRLEDEISDVVAAIAFVSEAFDSGRGLDTERMEERTAEKLDLFWIWHEMPGNNEHGVDAGREAV